MEQHFSFQGTSTRSQYWGTIIAGLVAICVVTFVLAFVAGFVGAGTEVVVSLITLAGVVAWLWLYTAVTVRRCRDAGINPWFAAATYLPYVGFIPAIVFGCLPTSKE